MTRDALLEALGEGELLLPDRVNRGLIASDRVQYYLTLLQAATRHAVEPSSPTNDLRVIREALGLHDATLDLVIPGSRTGPERDLAVPAASTIMHGLFAELAVMLRSLRAAGELAPELGQALGGYALRLARLHADAPSGAGSTLPREAIDALTRRGNGHGDSVHQLALDLRAELNRLLTLIATDAETLRGGQADDPAEIEEALRRYRLASGREGLFAAVEEHGRYVSALADCLRRAFVDEPRSTGVLTHTAELAHTLSTRAHEIVRGWTRRCYRAGDRRGLDVFRAADAAAGALDHTAFLLTLVPSADVRPTMLALADLPELVERTAQNYVRALDCASHIVRQPTASEVKALLSAIDGLGVVVRRCSDGGRGATARRFTGAPAAELRFVSPLAQAFITAAEAMDSGAVRIKDVLADAGHLS